MLRSIRTRKAGLPLEEEEEEVEVMLSMLLQLYGERTGPGHRDPSSGPCSTEYFSGLRQVFSGGGRGGFESWDGALTTLLLDKRGRGICSSHIQKEKTDARKGTVRTEAPVCGPQQSAQTLERGRTEDAAAFPLAWLGGTLPLGA